jgi:hypothetical protein
MHADEEQTLEWFQVAVRHYRFALPALIRVHPRKSVAKRFPRHKATCAAHR